jgi:hypothetical protein
MISGGVKTKRYLESSRRTPARAERIASEGAIPERVLPSGEVEALLGSYHSFAPRRSEQTTIFRPQSGKIAPATHLFSVPFGQTKKSAYLIENTRKALIFNSIFFNRLHTLFHSFPASPVFSTCSPIQRGYAPFQKKLQEKRRPRGESRLFRLCSRWNTPSPSEWAWESV